MAVIGEAIVGEIIEKLREVAREYLEDQKGWQTGMPLELKRLENALLNIQAAVEMAESGQLEITGSLRKWLQQLKDVLYDAKDALDELDYPRLQKLAEASPTADEGGSIRKKGKGTVRAFLSRTKKKCVQVGKRALQADPPLKALREVVKRMDAVAAHGEGYWQVQRQDAADNRETSSQPTEGKVFGRAQQREELLQWLKPDQCSTDVVQDTDGGGQNCCISLASLVGHGGMGKTTLAQSVYNDPTIQSHFNLRVWVCISNKFDIRAVTRRMLEAVEGTKVEVESLNVLQNQLRGKFESCRGPVLVVLDDAWNDQSVGDWQKLLAPLRQGLPKGSKVLLTTCMQLVADFTREALRGFLEEEPKIFHLIGLPKADFLPLFNFHAFGHLDPNDNRGLKDIGEKIAMKLGGMPLAAEVVGRMLYGLRSESYWRAILENSIIANTVGEQEILSVLRLSYHHLSEHLRPCFVYCSVFPQNYRFEKDELVRMWIAVGLVPQGEASKETGERYFDDLLKRSFFEPSGKWYIMHDWLHMLAESLSGGECFSFQGATGTPQIPKSVRHLYFVAEDNNHMNSLVKAKCLGKLHTLHLTVNVDGSPEMDEFCSKILLLTKRLRVLYIINKDGALSLDVVFKLKHLRFLSANTGRSVCVRKLSFRNDDYGQTLQNLHWLQWMSVEVQHEGVLDGLQPHSNLKELIIIGYGGVKCASWMMTPTTWGENLQSITLGICKNWECFPSFGRLPYLKVLKLVEIDAVKQLDCDGGFQQLEALHICLLENLKEFSGLDTWDGRCFPRLSKLKIYGCPELKVLPSLPLTTFAMLKLREVGLIELPELKTPPCSGDGNSNRPSTSEASSSSSLSKIEISFCPNLTSANGLLQHLRHPFLEELLISDCKQLADPQVPPQTFENLRKVTITDCGDLVRSLPAFLEAACSYSTQLYLRFSSIVVHTLPSKLAPLAVRCGPGCQVLSPLEAIKALGYRLGKLDVFFCPKLMQAAVQSSVSSEEVEEEKDSTFGVDKLIIDDPLMLVRVPPIRKLNSVRELAMGVCDCQLESMSEVEPWLLQNRTSLQSLYLVCGSYLQSLPAVFQLLSSLKELRLLHAENLNSLPQLPASLQELVITDANETLRERCRKDESADWPNINDIQKVKLITEAEYSSGDEYGSGYPEDILGVEYSSGDESI